ncbi:MAG: nucleotidyltransferase family protein [Actinomycetota bacterium]
MHAVVLVGGFGTRLRPLTNTVPKPLLPLGQRTILEWLLTHLARGGVTDAVLALGFKPEPFMQAFPDSQCAGVRLSYAIEDSPLDTAGAIGFAARAAGIHPRGETVVVANGDIAMTASTRVRRPFCRPTKNRPLGRPTTSAQNPAIELNTTKAKARANRFVFDVAGNGCTRVIEPHAVRSRRTNRPRQPGSTRWSRYHGKAVIT